MTSVPQLNICNRFVFAAVQSGRLLIQLCLVLCHPVHSDHSRALDGRRTFRSQSPE